jgi:hypothetical protein
LRVACRTTMSQPGCPSCGFGGSAPNPITQPSGELDACANHTRPPKPTSDLQLAVLTGRLVWPLDAEVAHPETVSLGQAKRSPSAVC